MIADRHFFFLITLTNVPGCVVLEVLGTRECYDGSKGKNRTKNNSNHVITVKMIT